MQFSLDHTNLLFFICLYYSFIGLQDAFKNYIWVQIIWRDDLSPNHPWLKLNKSLSRNIKLVVLTSKKPVPLGDLDLANKSPGFSGFFGWVEIKINPYPSQLIVLVQITLGHQGSYLTHKISVDIH